MKPIGFESTVEAVFGEGQIEELVRAHLRDETIEVQILEHHRHYKVFKIQLGTNHENKPHAECVLKEVE